MDATMVLVRLASYLDLTVLFGLAAFGLYGLRGEERSGSALRLRPLLVAAALLGLVVSAFGLLSLAASFGGTGLLDVDRETLGAILEDTSLGTSWIVRVAALALAIGAAAAIPRAPAAALGTVLAAGAVALATLAWTGHGAMGEGNLGWLHLGADIAHLLAAGIWIGALVALLLLVFRRSARVDEAHVRLSHRTLEGFSLVGTALVAVLVLTGVVNTWLIVGVSGLPTLPFSLYGQLLIAKLALFGVMLLLAALNRFRLTPRLRSAMGQGDHRGAMYALRRSLAVETSIGLAVLALVAWLGVLEPSGPM
ncbi:copper homeostasis membrane protein CopD [Sphingomonas lenta]|uniref:copper homeostasis membrane protein CopD n=1 Tax=Sphingomonas lenta TaxID=1141887 RepID=UPI0031846830